MTTTKIHFTKKLQKMAAKLIIQKKEEVTTEGFLGKWNATVFYVDRKKCWLISNGFTKYNVVLTDIKAADFKNIAEIFKNTLFAQFVCDGIIMTKEEFEVLIGTLEFFPTDNDRSTTAYQNQRLWDLENYKFNYPSLEEMPMKELTNLLNDYLITSGQTTKKNKYTTSITEMKELLDSYFKS